MDQAARSLDVFVQGARGVGATTAANLFHSHLASSALIGPNKPSVLLTSDFDADSLLRRPERSVVVDSGFKSLAAVRQALHSGQLAKASTGRTMRLHIPIAGGEKLMQSVGVLESLSSLVLEQSILIWTNNSEGALRHGDRSLQESIVYRENQAKIIGELEFSPATDDAAVSAVFGQLDKLFGIPERPDTGVGAEPPTFPRAELQAFLDEAQEQAATRLGNLAELWQERMREGAKTTAQAITQHTFKSFGGKADDILERLDGYELGNAERLRTVALESRKATQAAIREWAEPALKPQRLTWLLAGAGTLLLGLLLGFLLGIELGPKYFR